MVPYYTTIFKYRSYQSNIDSNWVFNLNASSPKYSEYVKAVSGFFDSSFNVIVPV